MRYDQDHKARVRERILSEAAKAIRRAGPAGLGIVDVMGAAGLTHGAFYAHFKSRDDLIAQTISYMFEERISELGADITTDTNSAAAILGRYVDRYLSPAHRDSSERGCPVAFLASDIHRLPESARQSFEHGATNLCACVEDLISELPGVGGKPPGTVLLAELVGVLLMARALGNSPASDQLLAETRNKLRHRLELESC